MVKRIYLNNDWRFTEEFNIEMLSTEFDDSKLKTVRIPHTCKETPLNYFDESIYQMVSLYKKNIVAPLEWKGKSIILTLDGVAHESEVFLNGVKVGEHHCGYTAFSLDLSDMLKYGEENVIAVKVDSREELNIPPFGYVVDYMTYGGIYRDVYIDIKNKTFIQDIFIKSNIMWDNKMSAKLICQYEFSNRQDNLLIKQYISKKGDNDYKLLGESSITDKTEFTVNDIELWDTHSPVLYEIKTQLLNGNEVLDENVTTFGFREAQFRKDGFYLNNKKFKIRGLNRHQSYPYVGYAMPRSIQEMDVKVLKYELGLNAVRTSHYPQSHYFLDKCDEVGLLVFTEIPGWQHIGNEQWKSQAVENTRDMVKQYRNHTSIILWGVRINESGDDDGFYERTNSVARMLDDTRQTAGVRAHKNSNLLEDVYTYNDFSHDGKSDGCESKKNVTSNMEKAYMVSEYNGHMYPTKAFDCEEHRVEHAMRHANVLDAVAGQEDICGSFGWCMADYNTHKDFGSGDRICYHGVMDMFRNPKLAAVIYACQQESKPILEISSSMDIGEHPGCNRGKTWIYTNADRVRMYKNGVFIKEYKSSESPYKNLKNGPILIDDFIGDAIEKNENFKPAQAAAIKEALNLTAVHSLSNLPKKVIFTALKMMIVYHMKPTQAVELYNKYIGDWGAASRVYKFEAIKDGKVVATVCKEAMKSVHLLAQANTVELLEENTYDVAAVRIQAKDDNDNLLPFYQEPVMFETEGPIEVIGTDVISLKGGMGGVYIKTQGVEGKAALLIKSAQAEDVRIDFKIKLSNERSL